MAMSPESDLAAFSEGTAFLVRRPFATLGMGVLGMVLAALAPLLQIKLDLPGDPFTFGALAFASLFPLEMYFIPRFLAEADASAGGQPKNPEAEWSKLFDERWMRAMAGKFLLAIVFALALWPLILPGLAVLFAFGWVPLRVLLRGETLAEAARGSLQLMLRAWRRVLTVCLLLVVLNLSMMMILSLASGAKDTPPTAWALLTQPRHWVLNFLSVLLSIWNSSCLLALYRRVEPAPPVASAHADETN